VACPRSGTYTVTAVLQHQGLARGACTGATLATTRVLTGATAIDPTNVPGKHAAMQESDIKRIAGANRYRSRAVVHGGFVWTVAAAAASTRSLREQTMEALTQIEANLREVGTDLSRLLTATVYITDIGRKPEMDAAWATFIPAGGGPQRACVEVAGLGPGVLVEITVMAALA
jgi:enamine deaminase RidA (YjgF/YER057c/UK114 family)